MVSKRNIKVSGRRSRLIPEDYPDSMGKPVSPIMPPIQRNFDRTDLIQAWLELRRYQNAHEDLQIYHQAASNAFSTAFGIDLEKAPEGVGFPDESGLHSLFLNVAENYGATVSPFSGYMCATREIASVYQRFGEALEEVATSTRRLHKTVLVDLVGRIWGDEVPMCVSQEKLENCGHPGFNAPDPIDYW